MNLLFFVELFYPYMFGGGEYIFFLIIRELARKGHNVQVVTHMLQGTKRSEIVENIRIHRVGSEIVYSDTTLLPSTIRNRLGYLVLATKKGREIILKSKNKGENIDLIHSNLYVPALSGHICARFYRIPHVITFHDVFLAHDKEFWKDWMSKQIGGGAPFYASTFAKLIERLILRLNVSAFHTVSEASMQDLMNFGVAASKISVIPNGIDVSQYQDKNDIPSYTQLVEPPTAVFVGRLVFYKNVETVIKAYQNVIKVIPNAQLIIIGVGPHKDNLIKASQGMSDNIKFAGRISHEEKVKIIKRSSFMVFPSFIEGFGIAIIEAFACRKPVLVSDVRPSRDIVRDGYTGYVLPTFNIPAWTDKIIELFNKRDKLEEMGRNAYVEVLLNYQIEKVASRTEKLYENIILNTQSIS
jgi:glycosyltransferase involved in cell wall biosynthesis